VSHGNNAGEGHETAGGGGSASGGGGGTLLPPPVGQYNDFVFTSESEMETGNSGMHTTHWKHGLKRHHQLEVKTERNNSCDTPSPGISPNAATGHHHHQHHGLMGDKVKRRKSDDVSVSSSMQESNDAPCSSSIEAGGGGGGANPTATGHSGGGGAGGGSGGGGGSRKKNSIRSQLAQQMLNSSTRVLKKPQYVVRPMPSSGSSSVGGSGVSNGTSNGINNGSNSGTGAGTVATGGATLPSNGANGHHNHHHHHQQQQHHQHHHVHHNSNSSSSSHNLAVDPTILKIIFRYLPHETLVTCCSVCKAWSNVAVDPDLWKRMNCAELKISASLLTAIVRRQPEHLILDWTQLAKRQLAWLVARLPALKINESAIEFPFK